MNEYIRHSKFCIMIFKIVWNIIHWFCGNCLIIMNVGEAEISPRNSKKQRATLKKVLHTLIITLLKYMQKIKYHNNF